MSQQEQETIVEAVIVDETQDGVTMVESKPDQEAENDANQATVKMPPVQEQQQQQQGQGGVQYVVQQPQEVPKYQLDQLARERNRAFFPFGHVVGINVQCDTADEVKRVVNFLLGARVLQFILLLISWACAASSLSKLNNLLDLLPDSIRDTTDPSISPLTWGLALGIIAWFFVIAHGVLGFLALGTTNETVSRLFAHLGAAGDLVLAFLSMSAFTALAVFGNSSASVSASVDAFPEFDFAPAANAAAAFMFFAFLTFVYTSILSLIIYKDRGILFVEHSALQQPSRPADNTHIAEV